MTRALGIDFGTTNSVVALLGQDGQVRNLSWPSAGGAVDIFRTALYFWSEGRPPRVQVHRAAGPAALDHALAGTGEGRFIQSIKTYLATRSFSETRLFAQRFSIEALVSTFLGDLSAPIPQLRQGLPIAAGRPVVFAGEAPDEGLAVERLKAAYDMAGFGPVELAYEPFGAAYWYARTLKRDETVLVADFGGGTSDFSVIRFTQANGRLSSEALSHTGVGVAGDTFDYRLVDHLVAPQLGKGSHYRSFGKSLPFPAYVHAAFARWHQLSWLKAPQTMRELKELAAMSEAPDAIEKLIAFLDYDLGFELYRAVSKVKTRLSDADAAELSFDSHGIHLDGRVTRADFESFIADDLRRIAEAVEAALTQAGCGPGDIDAVFMTGGTSHVPAVRRLFSDRFSVDRIHVGEAFQSVASGLALVAADRARVA
ncbi:Hsp70 family protein [Lichenihabitans sp. Uapishka_5]|uniref:Hsp70 family protein n=1 Tax=Lichenihabitans sp. Uapishka_5 TaxID=3037302 RepID=UPI0029E820C4|nr:Hsp70 family protein [Lichenihabitans sp. Uapishka_5]MDX7950717.1 Hsp70 family protein [Lichenihabitans sp. Uapishka_5]